jgi:type 1 glutamine amidotransferase
VTFEYTYKALTPEYLATLDVIILQDLRSWNLSASDIQNLADWVNGGGGLIALNGYMNDDDAEVTASNKAVAFTGMSYLGGGQNGSVPGTDGCPASSQQLCPQASSPCCYCWNNTYPVLDWDRTSPIAKDITAVGAYFGRQVNPGDATVVATYASKPVAATKSIGTGKAFLWCDEWVTYTSSWAGGQQSGNPDQWNPCYNSATSKWLTAENALQSKQFWYNVIRYVSPPTECDFVIKEPEVILLI